MHPAGPEQLFQFFFRANGRIGRSEYALGLGLIYALDLAIASYILARAELTSTAAFYLSVLALPLVIGLAVIMAKRCHDIGLPGLFFLLILVPIVGIIWPIALAFFPGNPGDNPYGPPPAFGSE